MPYVINQEFCSCCHQCRVTCPAGAITFRNAKYRIDPEKCRSCGQCARFCHNGCISDPDHPTPRMKPHEKIRKQCDVCVIGGGAAGMVAAAKAIDLGRSVIVLEKMHEIGGSAWYASGFRVHWSKLHEQAGFRDKREREYHRFPEKTDYQVDPQLLRRKFEANADFANRMLDEHEMGKDYQVVKTPMGPGLEETFEWERTTMRIDKMIEPGEGGWYVTTHLRDAVLEKGGEILCKTPARHLLTDEKGALCGVPAEDEGGEVEISCKAAVVATGSFSRNRNIMEKMQPVFCDDAGKEPVHIFAGAGSNGDGITMCEELGADIDYVNRRVNMFGPMRHPYPCASMSIATANSGVIFGSQGNLYEETAGMQEVGPLVKDPKWYCWKIIDCKIAAAAIRVNTEMPPLSPGLNLKPFLEKWRQVLKEEEIAGDVVSADSLEELAVRLGFDQEAFLQETDHYNRSLADPAPAPAAELPFELDEEDAMGPEEMAAFMGTPMPPMPIVEGPFYALKLMMFHENAVGGMTIDQNASVLRNGKLIPGLFAAGDTTRGIMISGEVGAGYIEGVFTALTQALNEGYIAAEEASSYCLKS